MTQVATLGGVQDRSDVVACGVEGRMNEHPDADMLAESIRVMRKVTSLIDAAAYDSMMEGAGHLRRGDPIENSDQ